MVTVLRHWPLTKVFCEAGCFILKFRFVIVLFCLVVFVNERAFLWAYRKNGFFVAVKNKVQHRQTSTTQEQFQVPILFKAKCWAEIAFIGHLNYYIGFRPHPRGEMIPLGDFLLLWQAPFPAVSFVQSFGYFSESLHQRF